MAKLSSRRRRRLGKKKFALQRAKKYPIHDKTHASNAKARATQQYKKGKINKATRDRIHARANKVLRGSK